MPDDSVRQRKYQRIPYKGNMEICVHSHLKDETLLSTGSNISDFGVCIYTFKPLKEGQDIIFKSNLPMRHQRGNVRWIKQCNRSIYRVGVLFTD